MKQSIPHGFLAALSLTLVLASACFASAADSLSLADAVARALEKHPSMAVFDAEKRAAEARVITALAKPNPELENEIEDVLGSGDYRGFDSAIYNVGISQLIETGGKRQLRAEVARAEKANSELQYDLARRELIAETGRRYIAVLAAQSEENNAAAIRKIASDAHSAIVEQIEGGRGSAVDSGQALLGKNEAELAYQVARQKSILARQQLSAMWADSTPDFSRVVGKLSPPSGRLPEIGKLNTTVTDHPAVALGDAGVAAASAELTLEEKNRLPDLTVGLGYRRDSSVDDNAVVLSFSLPLPLFNQNEGGIAEARAGIERSEALVSQAHTQIVLRISEAHLRLKAAQAEYQLVSGEILTAAEDHHRTLTEGFALGRIRYLDMLEARRSLIAVRKQKIEALAKYHSARVDLESLTGTKL
jgi:cobalt-zinc-cadmium efflux system outer membrane protein